MHNLFNQRTRQRYCAGAVAITILMGVTACNHRQTPTGGQRIQLSVGDIREISLPRPTDSTRVLTGTSDNAEVVDVVPKPAVATPAGAAPSPAGGSLVFLIKGVTAGTARVVFTEKQKGDVGDGQPKRTYQVQVTNK